MLTRLTINNYRGFPAYRVEQLAPVNLFVGMNNSGKTAILEGIQFLASGGDPAVLAEVAERRGEVAQGIGPGQPVAVDIAHFFHGHALTEGIEFSIHGDNGNPPVSVKLLKGTPAGAGARGPGATNDSDFYIRVNGPAVAKRAPQQILQLSADGAVAIALRHPMRRPGIPVRAMGPQFRFVGPDSISSIDLATMWDEITLSGQEGEVAQAMKVLQPNLKSLHFLTGMFAAVPVFFPSRAGIVVGIEGQDTRIPLGSMGDGMRRLMALATSLAFTKGGGLCVDEIDTGLHYSIMPDMWRMVIKKSMHANAQVFATTHSWDCIEGLSAVCQADPELGARVALHKVDRAIPHSVRFSGESIVRMTKSDIDPR